MGYVPVCAPRRHREAVLETDPQDPFRRKTIESRWYQTRRAPWNGIAAGDVVYFRILETRDGQSRGRRGAAIELRDLDDARKIVAEYGKRSPS